MKMSVCLQTATSRHGQRESRAIGQKISRDDNERLWANYKCLFFLDVGHDALWPSEYSIESHMVSYCSIIKPRILALSENNIES